MSNTNAIQKSSCACVESREEQVHSDSQWTYRPAVDIVESADAFTIYADIPGASKEAIDINVEEDSLTLQARVAPRVTRSTAGRSVLRQEYGVGGFHRRFRLGDGIDTSAVEATYRSGVLQVRLPKVARAQPRRVRIGD